jgi:phospholipid transport system substrate-binding protein
MTHRPVKSLLTGLCLAFAVLSNPAPAAAEDPQAVAQKVYAQIKSDLNVGLSNALVDEHFDIHTMAAQALGEPFRGFSAEQKTAYVQAFDIYFKKALYRVLTAYKDVTLSDLNSKVDGNHAVIRCVVKPAAGDAVNLALNLSLAQDSWKANDVSVENISLIRSYRPQFSSLYKQNGFDGLVEFLKSH